MTIEIIERDAEILFNKLVSGGTDRSSISVFIIAYIGGCCVLEDLSPIDLTLKFLERLKEIPK